MAPTRMKLRVRRRDTDASSRSGQPQEEERSRSSSTRSSSRRKNNTTSSSSTTNTAAAATQSSSTASPLPSSSSSSATRPVLAAEDTSPDSKCPICLDRFNNLAYLDRCLHRFCFPCIQEWSHNKAECPLCKQPFSSILHSVRAENDFKEYTLRPSPENGSVAATVAMVAAMASDHRMRLTLRRNRDSGEATRQRRHQRRGAIWEWFVDSPLSTIPILPHLSPVMDAEETQPFDLSERGVIFEGLTGLGGAAGNSAPLAANNRATRRLIYRLVARQRLQREGGRLRPLREREAVTFRRGLYQTGIRVRGVAGGSQEQPQREISAESFCRNPSNLNRLRPWLRRELTVLYGAHDSLITIVQRIIMARVARHGLEDLPTIEEELRPFLLARTDHFLHELVSFARSPLSLENYDLQAVYEPPEVAFDLDRLDSSTDSSEVIAISEEEEDEERRETLSDRVEPVQENQSGSCLSLSGWDDETPGPSYSTADTSCYLSSFSPAPHESATENRGGGEHRAPLSSPLQQGEGEAEEECLIVGYKKPIAERTPELVQLSSDSEDEKGQEKEKGQDQDQEKEQDQDQEKGLDQEKGQDEEKKDEKKDGEKETHEKATEQILPTIPPSTSFREEIVEEAQSSRSHSFSLSPGRSQTDSQRLLRKDRDDSTRKKRERRKSRRRRSSSGTFGNPNRSIFPPLTRRYSRSPSFESSLDFSSESDWRGYSVVSPLTSSCPSTPLSSYSSCFDSSPSPRSLARALAITPSPRRSEQNANAAAEKPGGKRKYKSRHLDSDKRDPTWKPSGSSSSGKNRNKAKDAEKTRREEREKRRRRRRRDRQRRESEESSRRREQRSPSVEIIYEGTVSDSHPPARKRRRRRRHRNNNLLTSSPLVITLDSDSGRDVPNDHTSSACSSPFGSPQTVDFCHFPALPLVHSSSVGGALAGGDFGELPVDILDRDSEKSDAPEIPRNKSTDLISVDNSNDSEMDIDVERVETSKTSISEVEELSKEPRERKEEDNKSLSSNSRTEFKDPEESLQKTNSDVADKQLLDSILSVLDGITGPKSHLPSTSESNCSQNNHFKNSSFDSSHVLTDKPKNQNSDCCQLPFYSPFLPPFQQLTENRRKCLPDASASMENSHVDASTTRTDIANEPQTLHNLDTHREIATSLLALRDAETTSDRSFPKQTPPFCDSLPSAQQTTDQISSDHNPGSTQDSDPRLLATPKTTNCSSPDLAPPSDSSSPPNQATSGVLNHKENAEFNLTDLVHEKVSAPALDIRNCNQTNAEDVV